MTLLLNKRPLTTGLPVVQSKTLRFYLLGPLRIEDDGIPIHLPRRKVESLVAYLLLHPQPHRRDALASLFWSDTSDAKARHSLRTALVTLRQQLGESLLLADREHVQINPSFPLWVDLRELLTLGTNLDEIALTNPSHLRTARALWQGPLLTGFDDDWVISEREHYHARLSKLFLDLTQLLRAHSEYAQAIEVAQKVLSFDPANEHAHQHLMFCYMATGDRSSALRQYELCEHALESELDVSPMPETTALYHWIRQQQGEEGSHQAKITNLPIPLTSFVGRTRQTGEIKRLLRSVVETSARVPVNLHQPMDNQPQHRKAHRFGHDSSSRLPKLETLHQPKNNQTEHKTTRLLTLIGAGGTGKTRLSIQVATDLIDSFTHGVWWVELAALTDGEQVAGAVAKTLGVNEVRNESTLQSIINSVGDKHLLLLIDNCEHLIESSAQLAAELLNRCPNLQILTTSREPLNILGEILWQVPPLSLPEPQQVTHTDLLLQFECIRLFVERATAVQQGFRLTNENVQAVAEICAQLDSIPLAIELAAARVKVLPVEQIAARLTSVIGARFDLLTQGSRGVLPRQQTLRAAIDWSYDLLDDDERLLFRQVAVCRGGFTLEAIEQITRCDGRQRTMDDKAPPIVYCLTSTVSTLDLLTQLVDKSLVLVEQQGGQNRYRLLETLREYALEQFTHADEHHSTQRRHAEYFLDWVEKVVPILSDPNQPATLDQFEIEHPNLRAALDFLIINRKNEQSIRFAVATHQFWEIRGYVTEGRNWLQKVLSKREEVSIETKAKALNAAGFLALRQSDFDQATLLLEEGYLLFQDAEDEAGIAEVLQNLAHVEMRQGKFAKAQQYLEQSLRLCRALNDKPGIARALSHLGILAWDQDKVVEAHDYFRESFALYQSLGDPVRIANLAFNLGNTIRALGDEVTANQHYQQSLNLSRIIGHKGLIAAALRSLGRSAFDQLEYDRAWNYGEESLHLFRQLGDKGNAGFALVLLGDVAHKQGDGNRSLAHYTQALQIMIELDYKWPIYDTLECIAQLLIELRQYPDSAAHFMGAAHAIRLEIGNDVPQTKQTEYEQSSADLQQQLGDDAFKLLWSQGQTTALKQILREVIQLSVT